MGKGLHERYLYCKNITQIFVLLWGYDLNLYSCGVRDNGAVLWKREEIVGFDHKMLWFEGKN